jgi:hypothetical protein
VKISACDTVFNWVQGFNSGKETAQAAVYEWHCNTPEEWLSQVIWKLWEMAAIYNLGGEYVELAVV